MSELKPCPFCGSIDVEVVHCDEVCSVCCDNCEAGYWTGAPGDAESVWNRRVSPWRSLKDDPPEPPTETTKHTLLVRDMRRDLGNDRHRTLVPHCDSDNGGVLRWFESHLDDVIEDVIEWGYTEWMEVPE